MSRRKGQKSWNDTWNFALHKQFVDGIRGMLKLAPLYRQERRRTYGKPFKGDGMRRRYPAHL